MDQSEEHLIHVEEQETRAIIERMQVDQNIPISEDEEHYLLTGEVLQKMLKRDEIEEQKRRLKTIRELFELTRSLNEILTGVDQRTTFDLAMAEMHAGQEELDRIGDAINEARNKHIATGGKNLKEAKIYKERLRAKQRICAVVILLAIVLGIIVVYFKVIKK